LVLVKEKEACPSTEGHFLLHSFHSFSKAKPKPVYKRFVVLPPYRFLCPDMRYAIQVKGKVQGVYFRKYTQWKAEELGLTGFVRNMPDGTVYIEAQGEEEKVELLEKWCHLGSPLSKVESVNFNEIPEVAESAFVLEH
jgi:acylphosphatase